MSDVLLKDFYNNPVGQRSIRTSLVESKRDLIVEYERMSAANMDLKIYKESDSSYWYHFLVPSGGRDNLAYDTVLHLTDPGSNTSNIRNWKVKFFSNAPSFVFKYAYVYNKHDLLIPELKAKLGELALTQPPHKTNPREQLGFDKSIFFACHYIMTVLPSSQTFIVSKKSEAMNAKVLNGIYAFGENMEHRNPKPSAAQSMRNTLVKLSEKVIGKKWTKNLGLIDAAERRAESSSSPKRHKKISGKSKITGKKKIR